VSIDEATPPTMKMPRRQPFNKEAVDDAPHGQDTALHDAPPRQYWR
jgi:hypothetical protein